MIHTNSELNLRARFASFGRRACDDRISIERGERCDYLALAHFHYRNASPGAVTAIFRAVHDEPTVVGRYLGERGEKTVIGVLVRSLPHLGCALRDHATHDRYRGMGHRAAAQLVNREFRTISRVVVDPRWRGAGVAVRLVKRALAEPETIFTEALAAMGRVHPFFEKAGMQRYDRPPRPEHARLADALAQANLPPALLASRSQFMQRLSALSPAVQQWIEHELRRWHRYSARQSRHAPRDVPFEDVLRAARDQLFLHPVYFLAHHGASDGALPSSCP